MTDFQKAATIYDYLAMNVTYDYAVANQVGGSSSSFGKYSCFSSYGAIHEGVAVCDGISAAFKLLCLIEGIEAEEYSGMSVTAGGQGGHAWNKVRLGGNWYGVDATWCTMKVNGSGTYVKHNHFLVDDASLYASGHRENATLDNGNVVEGVVKDTAYGAIDYYSVRIYGANVTRNVSTRNDFVNLLKYAKSIGATVVEFKNSSMHNVDSLMSSPELAVNGISCSGKSEVDSANNVWYVYLH